MTDDCIDLDALAKRLLQNEIQVSFTSTSNLALAATQLMYIAYRDSLNSGLLYGRVDSFGEYALIAAGKYLSLYNPQLEGDSNLFDNN